MSLLEWRHGAQANSLPHIKPEIWWNKILLYTYSGKTLLYISLIDDNSSYESFRRTSNTRPVREKRKLFLPNGFVSWNTQIVQQCEEDESDSAVETDATMTLEGKERRVVADSTSQKDSDAISQDENQNETSEQESSFDDNVELSHDTTINKKAYFLNQWSKNHLWNAFDAEKRKDLRIHRFKAFNKQIIIEIIVAVNQLFFDKLKSKQRVELLQRCRKAFLYVQKREKPIQEHDR